ncbi:MAG: division/cell wall cluster transcriptional repressor MraZ [Gemmatimonadales bacterium]|nr:MAG: division/cell wall cluster transcriptional repressor MraZ [Gemmatimonadales bacterium]
MAGFLGQYEYQLDQKGRVSLPADYRRRVHDTRFVLLQWEPTHLTLFPVEAWVGVQTRMLELRRNDPAMSRLLRQITARAVEVEPDKQGRILIPSRLKEAAGLDGAVYLIGALDRIEIWAPDRFDEAAPAPGEGSAELEKAVYEIFG